METVLATLKALADRNRLRVVLALADTDELCACQITELLGVTGATASRHLSQLVRAGILAARRDGRWVHYRLRTGADMPLAWARDAAAEGTFVAADRDALRRITAEDPVELCRRQRGDRCCPAEKEIS